MKLIPREFFQRHPAEVAPDLLGKLLVRTLADEVLVGRIVETEAYCSTDAASHTFRGQTSRNRAMFGQVGCAYVYFIHGLHHCLNVTARAEHPAGGVLLRALEPLQGIVRMQQLRGRDKLRELTSGPAKLTQALDITMAHYGLDMTRPGAICIAEPVLEEVLSITITPRIGISQAVDVPWRFLVSGNVYVSRGR